MARRETVLQRVTNPKPLAYAGLRALTASIPSLRDALSFYPDIAPLPADRVEGVAEAFDYRIRLAEPRFEPALARLASDNWDVCRDTILHRDPFLSRRFIGFVRDVIVPGHAMTPVDPVTRAQIVFGQEGRSNWNFAHPGLSALSGKRVAEPAIVVPAFWNLWHLFFEHLVPLVRAAHLKAWGGETLVVVTRPKRPPLIDAVVQGIREALGVDLRILEARPTQRLRLDRMLVAVNQCWNVERSYAFAAVVPQVRRVLEASYEAKHRRTVSRRLYVTRRNAKLRQVANEGDLVEGLERRGFTIFQSDWDNHPDQVAAFSRADIVVGPHGAGLSNIVFSAPGTRVLELFPADHRKTSMLHLAAEHDLAHEPFFGSKEGPNQAFTVDPLPFFKTLDRLLGGAEGRSPAAALAPDGIGH